jgi:hypothetical protein
MRHIRPQWTDKGGLIGEFMLTDFIVFANTPEMTHVRVFWRALVSHALTIDEASARLAESHAVVDVEDPEDTEFINEQHDIVWSAHFYLTRASILSLLSGFVEFCLLEVYQLVFHSYPNRSRPDLLRDIIRPLEAEIGQIEPPEVYKAYVLDSRETIRNALQHGRWMGLKEQSDKIDVNNAFLGVVSYMSLIEEALLKARNTQ